MAIKGLILLCFIIGINGQENTTWISTSEGMICDNNDCETSTITMLVSEQTDIEHSSSTISPHTKQVPPNFSKKESCFCDINKFLCDVDCCCDLDCSSIETQAFSHCVKDITYENTDYCISENVLYKNNTRYKVVKTNSNLLCIARDNLPESFKYVNTKVITTIKSFNKVLKRRYSFFWTTVNTKRQVLDSQTLYSSGSEIWVFNPKSEDHPLTHLEIPSVGTSSVCQRHLKVKFLKNIFSSCLKRKPSNKNECENNLTLDPTVYMKTSIVTSPALFNFSNIQGTPNEILTKIDLIICEKDVCKEVNETSPPTFVEKNNSCTGVLKTVECIFKHNGTAGIAKVICRLTVDDVKLEAYSFFRQAFKMEFEWIEGGGRGFQRSGKPGYQSGKPIISGSRGIKIIEGVETEVITPFKDPSNWISLPLAGRDGECLNTSRSNILFNENLKSSCYILISNEELKSQENCANFTHKIWKEFIGLDFSNNTEIGLLSAWGDPKEDKRSWVPLLLDNDENGPPRPNPQSCSNLPTRFELKFMTAKVGSFSRPQSKLIAAVITPKPTAVKCHQRSCRVGLCATVTFVDISGTAKAMFAAPPIITISLPKDFFYPFSSFSNNLHPNVFLIVIFIIFFV